MKTVLIQASGRTICRAEVADRWWTRMRGLLGRRGLAEDAGLWIRPCNSVHMVFMRFAIDVVYLDGELRVVKAVPRLRPYRFSAGGRKARSVLELPAGFLDREPLAAGQQLQIVA